MSGKKKGRLLITINGVSLTRAKWAERLGVTRGGISWMEHARGMTPEQAVRHFYLKRRKPRNCDRFATETDAQIAFLNEVWLISVSNLDRDPFDGWTNEMKSAYSKWLFAPAAEKEGGNNGNE